MKRFISKKGIVYIDGQRRWELVRRLPSTKLQFEAEDGELLNLSDAEVHLRWLKQEWVLDESSIGVMANAVYLVAPRDLATLPVGKQKAARRRLSYIQHVKPEVNAYNPERWKPLIAEAASELKDEKLPSPATVHRWWITYRANQCVISLVPHRRPHTGPRSDEKYAVFEEAVNLVYLSMQKLPKAAVVDEVNRLYDVLNNGRAEKEKKRPPCRATIYRWLTDLQQDVVDRARLGAEATRTKYRVAFGGMKVDNILERVEMDHSPVDMIVIDLLTMLPLGRPWLTLAIDKASRMVMGFYISFNSPSAHSVLQCLRCSILPKDAWLERFPNIKGVWPAFGIPDLVALDNGMDLHASAVEKTCEEMGIEILFCGARTPEHKGSVERLFRTLTSSLIHRLPGTVFSSVDHRGDYPAEELAVIDMETLVHLITKWIVEVYNVTRHRGIGMTPLQKWTELAPNRPIDLPVYPQELEVIIGIPARRTLFHYGIELEGMHYNSHRLQDIRRRCGENKPVDLKFYEDTVAHIHVFDTYAEEYIQVPSVAEEYAAKLPRDIHRLVREQARRRFGDSVSITQMTTARAEIEAIVRQAMADKKMAKRKGGAGLLMHDSDAVLNSRDPLEEARRPLKRVEQSPPPDLPAGLDDDLPDFPPTGGDKS